GRGHAGGDAGCRRQRLGVDRQPGTRWRVRYPRRIVRLRSALRAGHVPQRRPRRTALGGGRSESGGRPGESDRAPMIIAGCSRRKAATASPVPALDLYQGGCIPALRARTLSQPELLARTWIISAEHGLLHAETLVLPYDRRMDPSRALALRSQVDSRLKADCRLRGTPGAVLVIAEPVYQLALTGLTRIAGHDRVRWISNPATGWASAEAVLDRWSQS